MPKPRIAVIPSPYSIATTRTFAEHVSLDDLIDNATVGDVAFWSGLPRTPAIWIANCNNIGLLLNLRLQTNAMFRGEYATATIASQDQSYEITVAPEDDQQVVLAERIQNPGTSITITNDEFRSALNSALESLLWILPKLLPEVQAASYWDDLVALFPKP